MALSLPTMLYEIAFTTAPLATTPSWTNITQYVRRCSIKRGRNHELSRMEAGTCTLLLNNRDRRFDPTWTGGPYGANVKPMRKLRVSATWAGTTYRLFTGFVESWPVEWADQANSDVEVVAVDGFKVLALKKISGTAYSDTVTTTGGVVAYYRLDEKNGDRTVADSVGGHHGTYGGDVGYDMAGALPAEPNSAIHFGYYSGWADLGWAPITGTGNWSIEMWVYPQGGSSIDRVYHQGDGTTPYGHNPIVVYINDSLQIELLAWDDVPNGGDVVSSLSLTANHWNHVVVVKSGTTGPSNWHIYINGVDDPSLTIYSTFGTGNVNVGSYEGHLAVNPGSPPTPQFNGALDEVAFYNTALSGATVAAHYAKVGTFRDNALVGDRINEILDAVDWPAGDRDIDDGQFFMQPAAGPLVDTESLSYVLDLVQSEGHPAICYVGGDGDVVFHDRGHPAEAPSGTFGDGVSEHRYRLADTRPILDDSEIWNEVVYQRVNGKTRSRSDVASQRTYVTRTLSRSDFLNASDDDVETMAIIDLARYKLPKVRVHELHLHPTPDGADLYPQALGTDLNARKVIGRTHVPQGDPWSLTQRVEGIRHEIDHKLGDWHTFWQLGTTEVQEPFVFKSDTTVITYATGGVVVNYGVTFVVAPTPMVTVGDTSAGMVVAIPIDSQNTTTSFKVVCYTSAPAGQVGAGTNLRITWFAAGDYT